jgi:hypothetical protein
VIPTPLVPPLARPRAGPSSPWRLGTVVGTLLIVAGLAVCVVWAGAFSPLGFRRFQLVEADRRVEFKQAGSYVVYLERSEAAESGPVPSLDVSVVNTDSGVSVPVVAVPRPVPDEYSYDTLWYRGRAVARFDIAEPGTYRLLVTPAGSRLNLEDGIALGREGSEGWFGSLWAVAAFGLVPVVLGSSIVVASGVRGRRARRAVPATGVPSATGPPAVRR